MRYSGRVNKKPFAQGSKSAHTAVVLNTDDGQEFVLRRRGGNAFSDPTLDALVGKKIAFEGLLHNYTLIVSDWQQID